MPASAVAHSPAEMRRIAWSLVMAELKELEEGELPYEEGRDLCGQVESPADLGVLAWVLLDLAVMLWRNQHRTLAEARENAAHVALDLATQVP